MSSVASSDMYTSDEEFDGVSDDEPPEEAPGDERILSYDGQCVKRIVKVGSGLQMPGRHAEVLLNFQLKDRETNREWESSDTYRKVNGRDGPNVWMTLGEGLHYFALELGVADMKVGEVADIRFDGRYLRVCSQIRYNVNSRKKGPRLYLPLPPQDEGQYMNASQKMMLRVELVHFFPFFFLSEARLLKKVVVQKGRGMRSPQIRDKVTFKLGKLSDVMDEPLCVELQNDAFPANAKETKERVLSKLEDFAREIPEFMLVVKSMKIGERAILETNHRRWIIELEFFASITEFAATVDTCSWIVEKNELKVRQRIWQEETRHLKTATPLKDGVRVLVDLSFFVLGRGASVYPYFPYGDFSIFGFTLGAYQLPQVLEECVKTMIPHEWVRFTLPLRSFTDCPLVLPTAGPPDIVFNPSLEVWRDDFIGEKPPLEEPTPCADLRKAALTDVIGIEIVEESLVSVDVCLLDTELSPELAASAECPLAKAAFNTKFLERGGQFFRKSRFKTAAKEYQKYLAAVRLHVVFRKVYGGAQKVYQGDLVVPARTTERLKPRAPDQKGTTTFHLAKDEMDACDLGEHAELIEEYQRCHTNLALCLLKRSKVDECLENCDKVIGYDGRAVKALFYRAKALETKGSWDEALDDYKIAYTLSPTEEIRLALEVARKQVISQNEQQRRAYVQMFAS